MVRKLANSPVEKNAIIQSEAKLHDLGYVEFLDQLPKDTQDFILSKVRYVIPWRVLIQLAPHVGWSLMLRPVLLVSAV